MIIMMITNMIIMMSMKVEKYKQEMVARNKQTRNGRLWLIGELIGLADCD